MYRLGNTEMSVQIEAKLASSTVGEGSQSNLHQTGFYLSIDKNYFSLPLVIYIYRAVTMT